MPNINFGLSDGYITGPYVSSGPQNIYEASAGFLAALSGEYVSHDICQLLVKEDDTPRSFVLPSPQFLGTPVFRSLNLRGLEFTFVFVLDEEPDCRIGPGCGAITSQLLLLGHLTAHLLSSAPQPQLSPLLRSVRRVLCCQTPLSLVLSTRLLPFGCWSLKWLRQMIFGSRRIVLVLILGLLFVKYSSFSSKTRRHLGSVFCPDQPLFIVHREPYGDTRLFLLRWSVNCEKALFLPGKEYSHAYCLPPWR